MKKAVLVTLISLAGAGAAQAQTEVGRVLSSTPVIQQVAVPRQVCTNQQVVVQQGPTGAGAAMGALAGGAMGNAIGDGSGRAIATVIGLVGGAILGNNIERPGSQVQNVQQCSTQTYYENRAVSYNVVYEYAGRQYQVNMPNDPGLSVPLQVTPVMPATQVQPAAPSAVMPAPTVMAPAPIVQTYVTPAPVYYAAPAYPVYQRPYYYQPPVSLHFGYVHRGGGHRHWR